MAKKTRTGNHQATPKKTSGILKGQAKHPPNPSLSMNIKPTYHPAHTPTPRPHPRAELTPRAARVKRGETWDMHGVRDARHCGTEKQRFTPLKLVYTDQRHEVWFNKLVAILRRVGLCNRYVVRFFFLSMCERAWCRDVGRYVVPMRIIQAMVSDSQRQGPFTASATDKREACIDVCAVMCSNVDFVRTLNYATSIERRIESNRGHRKSRLLHARPEADVVQ
jgi:hypothetical protein